MAQVKVSRINKYFKNICAVGDVSLEAQDGEFLILVGPSGCGKTTLLRIIAGLEEPDSGEIWVGDKLVNDISPRDRDVAMVFQNYALYPHMSVFDNMAFGLKMRKVAKTEIQSRVKETAQLLGLQSLLGRRPKQLSGGQRQRVALGRAIVRNAQVFLMDEPLSNLDAKLRVQTRAELIKLHRRLGVTTIYVTHDQTEAMTMGERIAVLKDGLLQQVDDPITLYRHPVNQFVAGFIGSPTMNFLPVVVQNRDGGVYIEGKGINLRLPEEFASKVKHLEGKPSAFGIRPQDLYHHARSPISAAADNSARLMVDVVEPTGDDMHVYLLAEDTPIVANLPAEASVEVGQPLEVVFDMEKSHLFEPDTEKTIF
ncbi:MAG: sn-glycerol-3-phosphate ABC transporter ATP-binding protein UgpC [Armatimonadetes bacterium]|nr:sn-glycerol-3-phosphate ABC transporter ATP-binding protein UgpC [Armatimonadota bacterium]NIO75514.1 sn-glycerol-3-phosphate ABC transporter ATP-binding protein UgpC [Armatimonadota bacterium]NIO95891.1 sn-glycerol-3-phosphate ABC transporter ATP-binding protein UgpC [Armatimonadota bacterium]